MLYLYGDEMTAVFAGVIEQLAYEEGKRAGYRKGLIDGQMKSAIMLTDHAQELSQNRGNVPDDLSGWYDAAAYLLTAKADG